MHPGMTHKMHASVYSFTGINWFSDLSVVGFFSTFDFFWSVHFQRVNEIIKFHDFPGFPSF